MGILRTKGGESPILTVAIKEATIMERMKGQPFRKTTVVFNEIAHRNKVQSYSNVADFQIREISGRWFCLHTPLLVDLLICSVNAIQKSIFRFAVSDFPRGEKQISRCTRSVPSSRRELGFDFSNQRISVSFAIVPESNFRLSGIRKKPKARISDFTIVTGIIQRDSFYTQPSSRFDNFKKKNLTW